MTSLSARRDGNRAAQPVVGRRRPGSMFVPSFLCFRSILMPLLCIVLLRDNGIILTTTKLSTAGFGLGAWAFQDLGLFRGRYSLYGPSSLTSDCYGRKSTWDLDRFQRKPFAVHRSTILTRSSTSNNNNGSDNNTQNRIRLNKVFKRTHSRREADRLIEEGRVSVNGERVTTKGGFFVVPYVDEVSLDGSVIEGWEEMNYVAKTNAKANGKSLPQKHEGDKHQSRKSTRNSRNSSSNNNNNTNARRGSRFEYIKYWKPRGVICTTDPNIPGNIIDEIREHDGYDPPHRVYPVGRLDKETTGLILLTSDGRLPNAALRKEHKRSKTYEVMVDPPIGPIGSRRSNEILDTLRQGVVISTETVRNGVRKTLTAPTQPCEVEQLDDRWIRISLKEGRNRQVRKMTKAVGHRTVELERVAFAGIPLEPGLRGPGDWDYLRGEELEIILDMIRIAEEAREMEDVH